jgi:PIN domain nuclease of toxin-antitoxin system
VNVLLDTQIFLWFLADSRRLSTGARGEIEQAETVFVSAASIWEAAVKIGLGKLDAPAGDLVAAIAASGFAELPVRARHAIRVSVLPALHRDPFDRLLVAQAVDEALTLLTADATLAPYSELVRVV